MTKHTNHPTKVIGRVMTREEADAEEEKGNHVVPEGDGFRRIIASPKPVDIYEIDAIEALFDAGQIVIAAGGGGDPGYGAGNRHQKAPVPSLKKTILPQNLLIW